MNKEEYYIKIMQKWVEQFVIQLGLCPFASMPFLEKRIRYVVCHEIDKEKILMSFYDEIQLLVSKNPDELSTTLFIIPRLDHSFLDYLEIYDLSELMLEDADLQYQIQLASFHPLHQFEGTNLEDDSNYTNRSPFSVIHLLRVDEVEKALETFLHPEEIPKRNVQLMQSMGKTKLEKILFEIMKS